MKTNAAPRMTAALANREFRALWLAEVQSLIGDQLTIVALAILVYDRTGSALLSAVVYSLTFLPALAGGLGLSQLADRYPRRTVLVVSSLIQGVLIAIMAIPGTPLALLCGLVVLARLVNAPGNAAQNALTREVFTDDDLYLKSQDIRGISTNTAMLLGLAGGGLLVSQVGASWALALDAATFLLSAAVVRFSVSRRAAASDGNGSWFGAVKQVFGNRHLRVLVWFSWLVGLAVVPEGLAAPLAAEMGVGKQAVGWLLAADPLGFVIGAFLLSRFVSAEQRRKLLGVLAALPMVALIAFALQPGLIPALLLLAAAGAAGAYLITVSATFITWVPNELRGGAGGVYRTGLRVAQGVGAGLGGLAADRLGSATSAIALAGVVGLLLAVLVALSWGHINGSSPEPLLS
ncbi:Predicted arabinose efflux permease, MFS family [Amycolatopsis lurida]|uniref:Arabinose ABC transporter permease n=1 Tax=Amycolatopsis lurida NRRL 2430 TaxID=1460371 RepID=A0A2P2FPE1_AMYLU|nr:MFS transporter [Amycolatopsis lurida]KFU78586.1 arabinose ABC transporter permease [Amycolatopsis lurida NRRL 2430]SEE18883.1 Predicted arabinose efflux permease, MFS family [Amycolatopsis lurida]